MSFYTRRDIAFFSRSLIILFATSIALDLSGAEQMKDALARFESVAIKSSKSFWGGKGDSMRTVALLSRLRGAIDGLRWQEAIQLVHQIQYYDQTPEVVQLCGPLLETLRQERIAKEDAAAREMDCGVRKAGELLLAAREPKDLDPLMTELILLGQSVRSEDTLNESEPLRRARYEVNAAQQYVRIWQEYLAKRSFGRDSEAVEKLQSLDRRSELYPVVARSELLARMTAPAQPFVPFRPQEKIKEILGNAKSSDDLEAVYNALQFWANEQPRFPEFHVLAERVAGLRNASTAFLAGRYGEAFEFFKRRTAATDVGEEHLSILERQLLLKVLPQYLAATDLAQPAPDQSASEYLSNVAGQAAQKQNWPLVQRALETLRTIAFGNGNVPSWLSGDITGFAAIAVAERQTRAGEFAGAVASYRMALECNGQNIPVELIGQRLKDLRKSHPEAFVLNRASPSPAPPIRVY
jgi:hypothetical protein